MLMSVASIRVYNNASIGNAFTRDLHGAVLFFNRVFGVWNV